jgi:predicted esterase
VHLLSFGCGTTREFPALDGQTQAKTDGSDGGLDLGTPEVGSAEPDGGEVADAGFPDAGFDAGVPAFCPAAAAGLQEVTGTPASPYFVHHPSAPGPGSPTVVFVPGADGSRDITTDFIWPLWLANGARLDELRVLIPYTSDGDITDETARFAEVAAEALQCFGGDPSHVHLAGTSNGGLAAFRAMLEHPEPFATLLGAPGAFEVPPSDEALRQALQGKSVLLCVGELDDRSWRGAASSLNARLLQLGIDSALRELPGQGHILEASFDESLFFDFWLAH